MWSSELEFLSTFSAANLEIVALILQIILAVVAGVHFALHGVSVGVERLYSFLTQGASSLAVELVGGLALFFLVVWQSEVSELSITGVESACEIFAAGVLVKSLYDWGPQRCTDATGQAHLTLLAAKLSAMDSWILAILSRTLVG